MKKNKAAITADIIFLIIAIAFFIPELVIKITGKKLYLFGFVWDNGLPLTISFVSGLIASVILFFLYRNKIKVKVVRRIITVILAYFTLVGASNIYYYFLPVFTNPMYTESIDIGDGVTALISETKGFKNTIEAAYSHRIMTVYKKDGIMLVERAVLDEGKFEHKCIEENKYTWDYDKDSKTLEMILDYGGIYNPDTYKFDVGGGTWTVTADMN